MTLLNLVIKPERFLWNKSASTNVVKALVKTARRRRESDGKILSIRIRFYGGLSFNLERHLR